MQADIIAAEGNAAIETLREELAAVVGGANVRDEPALRALHSEDIWSAADYQVALIVTPNSLDQIVGVMEAAFAAGVPVAPRGASMSYTGSHLPIAADTLSLDLQSMNRVLRIDAEDLVVTVEPGCTWADLHAALAPFGLRTPFRGSMSGLASTIGGRGFVEDGDYPLHVIAEGRSKTGVAHAARRDQGGGRSQGSVEPGRDRLSDGNQ